MMKKILILVILLLSACASRKEENEVPQEETSSAFKDRVVSLYSGILENEDCKAFLAKDSDPHPRFQLVFIDDDDVPELALCTGDQHVNNVRIYGVKDDSLVCIGTYGDSGRMMYSEKRDLIISSFGGMGSFYTMYCEIRDHRSSLIAWTYEIQTDKKDLRYAGKGDGKRSGSIEEDREGLLIEENLLSEEEYQTFRKQVLADREISEIRYEDMKELSDALAPLSEN